MYSWKDFQKHWYLVAATAAILLATLVLVLMQVRSVRRTQTQAQALLEANLDLHLQSLVAEARRDLIEHADHVAHSIYQRLVRERDLPGLQRAVTRAARRFPEVRDFYVVFFAPRQERETWRALRFVPAPDDANAPQFNGAPLGHFVEAADFSAPLLTAWLSVAERATLATAATFAPVSLAQPEPRQIFFHPVYEGGRVAQQQQLAPVGLIALTVEAATYPTPDYWRALLARHAERAAGQGLPEQPMYQVSLAEGAAARSLAAIGTLKTPLRQRGFLAADGLFPTLRFQVAPHEARNPTNKNAGLSILLGLCAAALALVGVGMTWRAVQRERRVAQLKSDFLASISHELKTPLTAIRAFGDLLHSGRVRNAERIHEYGGLIKTESDRLTALINNILELSRLERGVRKYRLEDGTLCAAVAETVEVFRHSVEAQGFTIAVTLPTPPLKASFDANAIRQALLNLLSNAVRYAGTARRIEVTVEREQMDAVIIVRDFGIGIAASEQRRIFTPFYRAPQATERGLGIGLAIVREIIQAHGGEISVESEPGAGATFRLRLPLPMMAEEAVSPALTARPVSESN